MQRKKIHRKITAVKIVMKDEFKMKCETRRQLRQTMNEHNNENYHIAEHVHEPVLVPMILNKVIKHRILTKVVPIHTLAKNHPMPYQTYTQRRSSLASLFTFGWQVSARSHQLIVVGTRNSPAHSYRRWRFQSHAELAAHRCRSFSITGWWRELELFHTPPPMFIFPRNRSKDPP